QLSLLCTSFPFFFSSRRRHTRCLSDWSSDVCSSDLSCAAQDRAPQDRAAQDPTAARRERPAARADARHAGPDVRGGRERRGPGRSEERRVGKEGGCGVVGGSAKKKVKCDDYVACGGM